MRLEESDLELAVVTSWTITASDTGHLLAPAATPAAISENVQCLGS